MKQVDNLVCRLMRTEPGNRLDADFECLELSGTIGELFEQYKSPDDMADALDGAVVGVRTNDYLKHGRSGASCIEDIFTWYSINDNVDGPFYKGLREGLKSGDNEKFMDKVLSRIIDYEKDKCGKEEKVRKKYINEAARYAREAGYVAVSGVFLTGANIGLMEAGTAASVFSYALAGGLCLGSVILGLAGFKCWKDAKAVEKEMDEAF